LMVATAVLMDIGASLDMAILALCELEC
jgi:hypothetical protein